MSYELVYTSIHSSIIYRYRRMSAWSWCRIIVRLQLNQISPSNFAALDARGQVENAHDLTAHALGVHE